MSHDDLLEYTYTENCFTPQGSVLVLHTLGTFGGVCSEQSDCHCPIQSGMPLDRFFRKRIFKRIGMKDTASKLQHVAGCSTQRIQSDDDELPSSEAFSVSAFRARRRLTAYLCHLNADVMAACMPLSSLLFLCGFLPGL